MHKEIKWPKKTREMQTSMIDSTYWNDFEFRDDDIIVGTYQKAGTTWVQQIIAQFVGQFAQLGFVAGHEREACAALGGLLSQLTAESAGRPGDGNSLAGEAHERD